MYLFNIKDLPLGPSDSKLTLIYQSALYFKSIFLKRTFIIKYTTKIFNAFLILYYPCIELYLM